MGWTHAGFPARAGTKGGSTIPAWLSPFLTEHTSIGWAQMQKQVNRPNGPLDYQVQLISTADVEENELPTKLQGQTTWVLSNPGFTYV